MKLQYTFTRRFSLWGLHPRTPSGGSLGHVPHKGGNPPLAKVESHVLSQWNRWVAIDFHLDQSSQIRKQWPPLRQFPGEYFVEFETWLVACLVEEVSLLSLLKVVMNFLLKGLNLYNQYGCMIFLCVGGIFW
jgi:hypothetical protein